ncbi:MAG: hypothetical protein TR69_WS6001001349 [candidate division WS6 bacterium OLB20]|uniref:YdhG-like domain-containing protein n=1 Tax=candidate division WS6 bacterium OLB20 TaxID=1617426 RepID=A0A136LWN0_9BACT|nr:MAG: hypothetical protein TR69_WS6001001349 [candidate division WS6 bacterium OLB20]
MQKTDRSPDDYISSLDEERKKDMAMLDTLIMKHAPAETERVMWEGVFWGGSEQSIIGYGEMSYQRSDRQTVNWFLLGLASQKNYITVFVNVVEDKKYLTETYKDRLGKAKTGKSSISFKSPDDINMSVLEELIAHVFRLNAEQD